MNCFYIAIILVTWGGRFMRQISVKSSLIWVGALSVAAFARVHFRSVTTGVAYDLGQLKTTEGRLLEQRSSLRGELARLTSKKQLEELAEPLAKPANSGAGNK
jgi:hypothetical protein